MLTGIYPGSFDPVHNGHLDIALRASKLFDKLIVGVYDKPNKSNKFSGKERTEMFQNATGAIDNINPKIKLQKKVNRFVKGYINIIIKTKGLK